MKTDTRTVLCVSRCSARPFVASCVLLGTCLGFCAPGFGSSQATKLSADCVETCLRQYDPATAYEDIEIVYPFDKSVFPPEIGPPTIRWRGNDDGSEVWVVCVNSGNEIGAISAATDEPRWRPVSSEWEAIKRQSLEKWNRLIVLGIKASAPPAIVSAGHVEIMTSKDPVGAPLMYREVNLPFGEAARDTTKIAWRFGSIDKGRPPVVLERLPVCANCHSFSADGQKLGMDVDFGNDKGAYVLIDIEENLLLDEDSLMTWSDYDREQSPVSGGMLSSVSPSGRHVASTILDKSVFLARDDFAFSQLFFPASGLLAIYDCEKEEIHALPGADDPDLVQTNPIWRPDGEEIVFARAVAYKPDYEMPPGTRYSMILPAKLGDVFLQGERGFKFNLYRIPFNEGRGGTPEAIPGASHNGMSNYFPRFSPDGKWLVFCKAENFMLLMPDSELWIMPAEGGEARRMECNTSRMNSWHSFSPNGKWMVFSSKVFSDYTQLMLTHIGEDGSSTPPVVLDYMTRPDRAANIPEFVNASPYAIRRIVPVFLEGPQNGGIHAATP